MVKVICPGCRAEYDVEDNVIGAEVECSECHAIFIAGDSGVLKASETRKVRDQNSTMKATCPNCGNVCETVAEIHIGSQIQCPVCKCGFVYGVSADCSGSMSRKNEPAVSAVDGKSEDSVGVPDDKFCSACGTKISANVSFCPSCGKKVGYEKHKFCMECGKEISEGASFCPNCGWKVIAKGGNIVVRTGKSVPSALYSGFIALSNFFKRAVSVVAKKLPHTNGNLRGEPLPCKIAGMLLTLYGVAGVVAGMALLIFLVTMGREVCGGDNPILVAYCVIAGFITLVFKSAAAIKNAETWPRELWLGISVLFVAIFLLFGDFRDSQSIFIDILFLLVPSTPVVLLFQKSSNAWFAACKMLRDAAAKGDAESQYKLGMHYISGDLLAKNRDMAVCWLRNAANQGHENALKELERMGENLG